MQTKCRVRKLKIRTDKQALLPRITFLLEDALRTASFPGIPPNGVVYIKSMNLGCFEAKVNSRFLSNKIDAFLRDLHPVRVEANQTETSHAPAVWFADELEPYCLLTNQLAKGHSPQAWFWPVAVKGWSPGSPVSQSLKVIISQVAQKPTGLAGLAYVLKPLLKGDKILDLLNTMEQKTVVSLLSFLGLTPTLFLKESIKIHEDTAIFEEPFHPFDTLEVTYQELVKKALERWGTKDYRLILIICLGLAESRHAVDPSHAIRVIEKAIKRLSFPPRHSTKFISPKQNESIPARPSSDQALPDYDTPEKERQIPSVQQTDHIDLFQENEGLTELAARDHKTLKPEIEANDKEQSELRDVKLSPGACVDVDKDPFAEQTQPLDRIEKQAIPEIHTKGEAVIDRQAPPTSQSLYEQSPWPEQMYLFHPFAGDSSGYAGFPFLITVLNKLGFENIFYGHDEYPAFIMAQRILWRIARWQKIPEDDPVLQFLKKESDLPPHAHECKHPLNRQTILHIARDDVKEMFKIPQSRDPLQPLYFNQVIHIFVIAVCRYIHRHAKITIRNLIMRPAFVALTKTHMDITTSMKNLDIRIRLAGLDINPGWVPWLGRVIQFHYTEDEF